MAGNKSYWMGVSLATPRDHEAVRSWFNGLLDEDDTIYKAEILCDKQTDREKKIRAFLTGKDNRHLQVTRTVGRTYTITRKRLPPRPTPPAAKGE